MDTRLFAGILLFLRSFCVCAQSGPAPAWTDSGSYRLATEHTVAQYFDRAGDQANIYNGAIYPYFVYPFTEGSPFFNVDSFSTGSLVYDSVGYGHVPLLYDDLREYLVTINSGYWLRLVKERISSFEVKGSRFIRIYRDSTQRTVLKTGFYEVLYTGRNVVLKKTVKSIREVIDNQTIRRIIDTKRRYYIQNGGRDYLVASLEDIMDLFDDKKTQLIAYRKKNRLRFRKQPEKTIVMLTSYYDQLNQGDAKP